MFDIERFRVLLRGDDEPKNDEERQWLINYKENERLSAIKRQEEEEQSLKNHYNAYREYYALIKSTFPKSFFYKNPISDEEYEAFEENSHRDSRFNHDWRRVDRVRRL